MLQERKITLIIILDPLLDKLTQFTKTNSRRTMLYRVPQVCSASGVSPCAHNAVRHCHSAKQLPDSKQRW